MSFITRKHAKYAMALNLDLEQFDELANRMVGHFKKRGVNTATVKDAFFVLIQLQNEELEKKRASQFVWGMHIPDLKEHGWRIVELRKAGKGYDKIHQELKLSCSRTTVANFCRNNGI